MANCVIKYKDRNFLLPFFSVVSNVPDAHTLALAVICFSEKFCLVFECHHLKKKLNP